MAVVLSKDILKKVLVTALNPCTLYNDSLFGAVELLAVKVTDAAGELLMVKPPEEPAPVYTLA
ncbi:hypothetical protein D3C85_1441640 [compost metagenome]